MGLEGGAQVPKCTCILNNDHCVFSESLLIVENPWTNHVGVSSNFRENMVLMHAMIMIMVMGAALIARTITKIRMYAP